MLRVLNHLASHTENTAHPLLNDDPLAARTLLVVGAGRLAPYLASAHYALRPWPWVIVALASMGMTFVVVEHVMEVITDISHRIAVFDSGELIVQGLPERVMRDDRVIKAYLGERYVKGRME